MEAFFIYNTSQSTTLASVLIIGLPPGDLLNSETTPIRFLSQAQLSVAQPNILATLKVLPLPNEFQLTIPAGVLVNRLLIADLLAPETILARAFPQT